MYQKLLAIYESDLVSQGSKGNNDSIENIPELTKLAEQITRLEENQKQLWSAVSFIAEKLGYSLGKMTSGGNLLNPYSVDGQVFSFTRSLYPRSNCIFLRPKFL